MIEEERAFAFLSSLQQQLECYRTLKSLCASQHTGLTAHDEVAVLRTLERKQKIIEEVEKVGAPFRKEREELSLTPLGQFSPLDEEIDLILLQTENLLRELAELESQDLELVAGQKNRGEERMKQLEKGRDLVQAYRRQALAKSPRLNRKG